MVKKIEDSLCLFVSREYRNVMNRRTDRWTPRNGIGRAYA